MEKRLVNIIILIIVGGILGWLLSSTFNKSEDNSSDYKTKIEGLEKANLELSKEKLVYKARFDSAQSVIDTVAVKLLLNTKKGKNELAKIDTLSPAARKRYTDSLFARAGIK